MDIKLINVILYFFEYDVAVNITDKLLERLKTYKNFEEAVKLTFTLTLNLSLILIKNGFYFEALNRLENLLEVYLQEMPYRTLIVCYNRMAICYSFISKEKDMTYVNKIETLLDIYVDPTFKQIVQLEFNKYSKSNINK